ncbi:endonuclease MutS2 [candidate division KSB1 bacterium]|nr:endonuclease MutS2 [candidate division KSB1 bacterium]
MKRNVFETLEFDKVLHHIEHYAISPLGLELISAIKPLRDQNDVIDQLDKVTEFRVILDFDDPLSMYGLSDIRSSLEKTRIPGSHLSIEKIAEIHTNLVVFRKVSEYFSRRREKYPLLSEIAAKILPFKSIEKEINRCIDLDSMEIRDNATPALAQIRRSLISLQHSIRKRMDTLMKQFSSKNYLQENVVTLREGRLVLMVKSESKSRVKGVIHDQSATGATLFVEPLEILDMNNQVRALLIDEEREIEKILISLTAQIAEEIDPINMSLTHMAMMDFMNAKARFSAEISGNQPLINENGYLHFIDARHPLLLIHKGNRRDAVIPLNLAIGDSYTTLIISGPNAGGKTITLKTIGLLSLMLSCGLHIPVDPNSDLFIFNSIYSAIGDEQSIENDLSTFSSHIEKLKYIVDNATSQDLVIIDEIAAGTDPEEGAALAISILEKLTAMGCVTVVTTHLGALKVYAHERDRVENGSMEFDGETLQPTYRFRSSIPGSSYAFEIGQRYGLSDEIINRSRELVGIDKNRMENLLIDLDKKITTYQSRLNEMSIKQTELDALLKFNQVRKQELLTNEKTFKQRAVIESENIISTAKSAIEKAIREIKEKEASHEAIKYAQQLIKEQQQKLQRYKKELQSLERDEPESGLKTASRGMSVKWVPYDKHGTVLSDVDSAQRVLIETDGIRIKVPLSELTETKKPGRRKSVVNVNVDHNPNCSFEIDLRGMNADEAIAATDKFIEEAILGGLNQVYIIHGKGTGVLRTKINQFLETHEHVKMKRLADWNQGGTGVTVVELK